MVSLNFQQLTEHLLLINVQRTKLEETVCMQVFLVFKTFYLQPRVKQRKMRKHVLQVVIHQIQHSIICWCHLAALKNRLVLVLNIRCSRMIISVKYMQMLLWHELEKSILRSKKNPQHLRPRSTACRLTFVTSCNISGIICWQMLVL